MEDGKISFLVIVQIPSNQKVKEIKNFLHRHLLIYSREDTRILEDGLDELPMILADDFNINYAIADSIPYDEIPRTKIRFKNQQ
ncbi:hypothetical protein PV327_004089 [Microctonus hyperodae]|uniref:Uncharacterized protein n=1 Tax=Microctonus hyperodae TaxID=165561 RepID=A0AA39FBU5_MICHY|nr:hypothetical protein PV327_004089 [Microctonus hyperodae]